MSLIETSTDVELLTFTEAKELTSRIRQTGSVLWAQIVKAYQGRAWVVLGYPSWDEYCDAEFDGARLRLPREERTMVVASLSDAGLSTRAIGAAIGVHKDTVRNDLAGGEKSPPHPDPDDEITDAEIVEDVGEIDHQPRTVTGIDGKTYPKNRKDKNVETTTRASEVEAFAKLGLTVDDIAEELDITPERVRAIAGPNKIDIKGWDRGPVATEARWTKAQEMAEHGWSSHQIAAEIGVTAETVRSKARELGFEIRADQILGRQRHVKTEEVVENVVNMLDGIRMSLSMIEGIPALDAEKRREWLKALDPSLTALKQLRKELNQ